MLILRKTVGFLAFVSYTLAGASQTRTAGLALDASSAWMFTGLYPQLFLNPAFASEHKNRFLVEASKVGASEQISGGLLLSLGSHTLAILYGDATNDTVLNRNDHPRGMFYDARNSTPGIADNRFIDVIQILRINTAIVNSAGLALADSAVIYENIRNPLKEKNFSAIYALPLGPLEVGTAVGFASASDIQIRQRGPIAEELRLFKAEIPLGFGFKHSYQSKIGYRGFDAALRYIHYLLHNRYDERDSQGRRVLAALESDGAHDWEFQAQLQWLIFNSHLLHLRGQLANLNSSTIAKAKAEIDSGCPLLTDCVFHLQDTYLRKGKFYSFGISDEIQLRRDIVWFIAFWAQWETLENSFDGEDIANGGRRRDGTVYGNKAPIIQKFHFFQLPAYLGMEVQLSPAWLFRFGINQHVVNRRRNSVGLEAYNEKTLAPRRANNEVVYQTFELQRRGYAAALGNAALGLSWQPALLTVDWLLNLAFVTAGPNFISGKVHDLSLGIALTYHFQGSLPQGSVPIKEGTK